MRRCQGRTLATVGKEAGEAEVYTVQSWHDKNCWRSYNECEKNFQISHSCANWANCYVFIRVNMSATISNHQFENLSYCLCPIPLRPLVSWYFFFYVLLVPLPPHRCPSWPSWPTEMTLSFYVKRWHITWYRREKFLSTEIYHVFMFLRSI